MANQTSHPAESQNTMWAAAAVLSTATLPLAWPSTWGLWSVALFLPALSGLICVMWLVIRGLAEVLIRRCWPTKISEHFPAFVAGTKSLEGPWWTGSLSERIALADYQRYLRHGLKGIRAQFEVVERREHIPPGELRASVLSMTRRWSPDGVLPIEPLPNLITVVDPIHASITLGNDFDWLLHHPLLQRLHEVRQLAFAFPRFPSATHTRFAHSLGVAHLAGAAMQRVLDRGKIYNSDGETPHLLSAEEQRRLVNLAIACGLVHDIGHPPLGHTLDRFFGRELAEGDQVADKKLLPHLLRQLAEPLAAVEGINLEAVEQVLLSSRQTPLPGWDEFVGALVNSELDVDRLDYLKRDAHFTGQHEGLMNLGNLVNAMRPYGQNGSIFLSFDEAYLNDLEQFVYARDAMYLRCYEHPSKSVSEWLILRATAALIARHPELRDCLTELALLSDSQLIQLVMESRCEEAQELFGRAFRAGSESYEEVFSMPFVSHKVDGRLQSLHGDFALSEPGLLEKVRTIESDIAKAAGIDLPDLVLTLPGWGLSDEREPGHGILVLRRKGRGFESEPLATEDSDKSVSNFLIRTKMVPQDLVASATDLEDLKRDSHAARGISMFSILRKTRFKLRLLIHRRAIDRADHAVTALKSLGVRDG